MSSGKKWPGQTDETHPEVFGKPPEFPTKLKPGMLTREQFEQFFDQGFVQVDKFFTDEEMKILDGCRQDIEDEVEDLAQGLYKAGKIKKLYKECGLFQRLTELEKEYPGTSYILHRIGHIPKHFQKLMSLPRLLNVIEQLQGTADLAGNPNWNLRCKTPDNTASTVPWHQDCAYADNALYSKLVITGWIPFLDTNENNGCMQVIKYGQKKGKVATHKSCWKDTPYLMLDEDEMVKALDVDIKRDTVLCPVPYGGILLFSNLLPHRSLNNRTNDIRWSVDFRWQRADIDAGFFGTKKPVQLRSSTNPNMEIDWAGFDSIDRHTESLNKEGLPVMEFDTTTKGPWMKKWELINTNRHTDAYFKELEKLQSKQP